MFLLGSTLKRTAFFQPLWSTAVYSNTKYMKQRGYKKAKAYTENKIISGKHFRMLFTENL